MLTAAETAALNTAMASVPTAVGTSTAAGIMGTINGLVATAMANPVPMALGMSAVSGGYQAAAAQQARKDERQEANKNTQVGGLDLGIAPLDRGITDTAGNPLSNYGGSGLSQVENPTVGTPRVSPTNPAAMAVAAGDTGMRGLIASRLDKGAVV